MLNLEERDNSWNPPEIEKEYFFLGLEEFVESEREKYLVIYRVEPYIDAFLYTRDKNIRLTFREDYCWDYETEQIFEENCIMDCNCGYTHNALMDIYRIYSAKHPEWNLKRYHNKGLRLLDHIYNCMRKNSAKEILYKAGLDELALYVDGIDELNLLAGSPSQIYDGISMRTLRAMNCEYGAKMLLKQYNRSFISKLQVKFPDIFKQHLNDAQCRYLEFLITGELTVNEVGRLFLVRFKKLAAMWTEYQYQSFLAEEKEKKLLEELKSIDPIYEKRLMGMKRQMLEQLKNYLIFKRETYDSQIRRVNRFHDPAWQERDSEYIIRFPQTINDFCREAVYMGNCLLTYVEPYTFNDTVILFMRKADDVNTPFITVEIFDGVLQQAYSRFNEPIEATERKWLSEYCLRHGIDGEWLKYSINDEFY